MRAPSQYVCSLDNQRTEAPSGRVSRTWRLATSISVTSFEPTLKTYTVSRLSAAPAGAADRTGAVLVVGLDDPQAEASRPSAAPLAPLRTARRSRLADRNQSVPPTSTPFASSREAQSSGAQCEGGLAAERGLIIAFDIVTLHYSEPGSMPFALIVRAAAGANRYLINAESVSASLLEAPTPAKKTKSVVFCSSAGKGPTSSTPGTPRTTIGCTIASSASRLARTSAYSDPGTSVVFAFISVVIPRRSISCAACTPVAPPFVGSG